METMTYENFKKMSNNEMHLNQTFTDNGESIKLVSIKPSVFIV